MGVARTLLGKSPPNPRLHCWRKVTRAYCDAKPDLARSTYDKTYDKTYDNTYDKTYDLDLRSNSIPPLRSRGTATALCELRAATAANSRR